MVATTEPGRRLFGTGRQMLQREAARWWWAPLVAAVIWFVIAWLVLRANYSSLATVGVLVGVVLLIATINEVALSVVVSGGWRVAHIALAVLYLLGALWGFIRPVDTFFALASVLGLLLFLQGLFYLMRGIALKEESSTWWLDLVGGGLLIALALWISTSDRVWTLGARAAFILVWVGFFALFRGFSDVIVAFELRRLGRGARVDPLGAGEADSAVIPPQDRRTAAERERQDLRP
jgi:uncharacterized membrane protein HdeD (DUF308 family)